LTNFASATAKVREAVYAVLATGHNGPHIGAEAATAFCIAPGVLVTAAHVLHSEGLGGGPPDKIEVIAAPDLSGANIAAEIATILADDPKRDLALLSIDNPKSKRTVRLLRQPARIGTPCGCVGFPLTESSLVNGTPQVSFFERFRGAYLAISLTTALFNDGPAVSCWETDALMYPGSSGCPGYIESGDVFGMHIRSRLSAPSADAAEGSHRMALSLWVAAEEITAFAERADVRL
jgi:S1-C subfamily serine protease